MIHFTNDSDVLNFGDTASSVGSVLYSEASMDSQYSNASIDSRNSQATQETNNKRKFDQVSCDQNNMTSKSIKCGSKTSDQDIKTNDHPGNHGNQKNNSHGNHKRRRPRPGSRPS